MNAQQWGFGGKYALGSGWAGDPQNYGKLNESNKPATHNILFDAGYNPKAVDRHEWKKTTDGQNYYVTLQPNEWYYNKPQRGNHDDICAFGDYSPAGLDKLRNVVTIDPTESE